MLFLLNDCVLNLAGVVEDARAEGVPLQTMPVPRVTWLGQKLFAQAPRLPHTHPESARRLASLICAAAPSVNAALFLAPSAGCSPQVVTSRFADVDFEVIARLYSLQKTAPLSAALVHHQVWRQLAA